MKKEEILSALLQLSSKKGLRGLSMSEIAASVGLKKSSLYSHFASKEDMINELYLYLRRKAEPRKEIDYLEAVKGKDLKEIFLSSSLSYDCINRSQEMKAFYKVIISEKTLSKEAAGIIIKETKTMMEASRRLFEAIEKAGIASFFDIDTASLSFALLIHSVLELRLDAEVAESDIAEGVLERIINGFIKAYSKEEI